MKTTKRSNPAPLLVGEANPHSMNPAHALWPWPGRASGARFKNYLGLTSWEFISSFDRVNLFTLPPRPWNAALARHSAGAILGAFDDATVVLMLGARVADAFGMGNLKLWGSRLVRRPAGAATRFVRLPHPSGRNREWNDPAAARKLRRVIDRWTDVRRDLAAR